MAASDGVEDIAAEAAVAEAHPAEDVVADIAVTEPVAAEPSPLLAEEEPTPPEVAKAEAAGDAVPAEPEPAPDPGEEQEEYGS